jgi:hypothetical protein
MNKYYRYTFAPNISPEHVSFIKRILDDNRGWSAHGFALAYKPRTQQHDVIIHMLSNRRIKQKFGAKFNGLSVTDYGCAPIEVYINSDNWMRAPPAFVVGAESAYVSALAGNDTQRQLKYRAYLIQHEFGHALGFDHEDAPGNSATICPVMYQQTKGTGVNIGKANEWPAFTSKPPRLRNYIHPRQRSTKNRRARVHCH